MIITFLIALVKWWIFSIFRKNWHLKITKTDQTDKPMACGLSTEMELEIESMGVWGETLTGIPGEKTLGADLLKEPTANSTHTASTRLTFHMQVKKEKEKFVEVCLRPPYHSQNVPWGNFPLYTCSDVKEMYEKRALHVQSFCFGPFLFLFLFFFFANQGFVIADLSQYRTNF